MNISKFAEDNDFKERDNEKIEPTEWINQSMTVSIRTTDSKVEQKLNGFEKSSDKHAERVDYSDGVKVSINSDLMKLLLKALGKDEKVTIQAKDDYPVKFTIGNTSILIAPMITD